MADSSEEEASSICSRSEEYLQDDGSDTDSSDSVKSTLRKVVNGPTSGVTGFTDSRFDTCAAAPPSALIDDNKKRQILDAAVDAILKKKETIRLVRQKFKLTSAELDQALLEKGAVDIVKNSRSKRRNYNPEKTELLRKAVIDVTSNGMSVIASARLHKIHRDTLNRELIDQGVQFPLPRNNTALQAAVQDVINQKMAVHIAGRTYKVCRSRLRERLQALGYFFEGPRKTGKWIKQCSGPDNDAVAHKTPDNRDSFADDRNIEKLAPLTAPKDGEYADDNPAESTQEIEKIVGVRTSRQYLVKWQGETDEQATWVDEDVFLGLTKLSIKYD